MTVHQTLAAPDRYAALLDGPAHANEPVEIRQLRRRLLVARDCAGRTLAYPEQHRFDALALSDITARIAGTYAFRLTGTGELEDAANACLRLLNAATIIDRLEALQ
jgi:hypothetical protein